MTSEEMKQYTLPYIIMKLTEKNISKEYENILLNVLKEKYKIDGTFQELLNLRIILKGALIDEIRGKYQNSQEDRDSFIETKTQEIEYLKKKNQELELIQTLIVPKRIINQINKVMHIRQVKASGKEYQIKPEEFLSWNYFYSIMKDKMGTEYRDLDRELIRELGVNCIVHSCDMNEGKENINPYSIFVNGSENKIKENTEKKIDEIISKYNENKPKEEQVTMEYLEKKYEAYISDADYDQLFKEKPYGIYQGLIDEKRENKEKIAQIEKFLKNPENLELYFDKMYGEELTESYRMERICETASEETLKKIMLSGESLDKIRKEFSKIYYEKRDEEVRKVEEKEQHRIDEEKKVFAEDTGILISSRNNALYYNKDSIMEILNPRINKLQKMLKSKEDKKNELIAIEKKIFKIGRKKIENELEIIEKEINDYRIVDDVTLEELKKAKIGDFTEEDWNKIGACFNSECYNSKREGPIYFSNLNNYDVLNNRTNRILKKHFDDNRELYSKYDLSWEPQRFSAQLEEKKKRITQQDLKISFDDKTKSKLRMLFLLSNIHDIGKIEEYIGVWNGGNGKYSDKEIRDFINCYRIKNEINGDNELNENGKEVLSQMIDSFVEETISQTAKIYRNTQTNEECR